MKTYPIYKNGKPVIDDELVEFCRVAVRPAIRKMQHKSDNVRNMSDAELNSVVDEAVLTMAEKYDPGRSTFVTYIQKCFQWILLTRLSEQDNGAFSLDHNQISRRDRLQKFANEFKVQHGRYPNNKDLCNVDGTAKRQDVGNNAVALLQSSRIDIDESATIYAVDSAVPDPQRQALARQTIELINEKLAVEYSAKERDAFIAFADAEICTKQVADKYNITRTRLGQIAARVRSSLKAELMSA